MVLRDQQRCSETEMFRHAVFFCRKYRKYIAKTQRKNIKQIFYFLIFWFFVMAPKAAYTICIIGWIYSSENNYIYKHNANNNNSTILLIIMMMIIIMINKQAHIIRWNYGTDISWHTIYHSYGKRSTQYRSPHRKKSTQYISFAPKTVDIINISLAQNTYDTEGLLHLLPLHLKCWNRESRAANHPDSFSQSERHEQ